MPCLNFQETSNLFLTADPARHVVCFSKCKKETAFSFYTTKQFIDACLYEKQASKARDNTFKGNTETMYVSQLHSLINAENESNIRNICEKEFEVQAERPFHKAA